MKEQFSPVTHARYCGHKRLVIVGHVRPVLTLLAANGVMAQLTIVGYARLAVDLLEVADFRASLRQSEPQSALCPLGKLYFSAHGYISFVLKHSIARMSLTSLLFDGGAFFAPSLPFRALLESLAKSWRGAA